MTTFHGLKNINILKHSIYYDQQFSISNNSNMDVLSQSYPHLPSLSTTTATTTTPTDKVISTITLANSNQLSLSSNHLPKDTGTSLQSLLDAIGSSSTQSLMEDVMPSSSVSPAKTLLNSQTKDDNQNKLVNTTIMNMFGGDAISGGSCSPTQHRLSKLSAHSTSSLNFNDNNISGGQTKSTELLTDDGVSSCTSCSSINNDSSIQSGSAHLPSTPAHSIPPLPSPTVHQPQATCQPSDPPLAAENSILSRHAMPPLSQVEQKLATVDVSQSKADTARWSAVADIWDTRNIPNSLPKVREEDEC